MTTRTAGDRRSIHFKRRWLILSYHTRKLFQYQTKSLILRNCIIFQALEPWDLPSLSHTKFLQLMCNFCNVLLKRFWNKLLPVPGRVICLQKQMCKTSFIQVVTKWVSVRDRQDQCQRQKGGEGDIRFCEFCGSSEFQMKFGNIFRKIDVLEFFSLWGQIAMLFR